MIAIDFLKELHVDCHFLNKEGKRDKVGRILEVSNREFRRWFDNNAVIVDGRPVAWDHKMVFPIHSLVLFPKHPVTLWDDGKLLNTPPAHRMKLRWFEKMRSNLCNRTKKNA